VRILVLSPIPSDPHHQGNSVRIARINELFQYFECTVHFLYYGLEGLDEAQREAMTRRWDHFHFVRCDTAPRQTRIDGYDVDDYFGRELRLAIRDLQKTWSFDAIFCNYVWMSAALEELPESVFKIIDTHDIFGDRQYVLQSQSVAPAWIYMSPAQETRGLDRADLVVAIQDEERDTLAERTRTPVVTIGHILPANFLRPRETTRERLRVGYIASDNPSNRISLQRLVEEVASRPRFTEDFRISIAGRVGARLPKGAAGFEAMGFVDDTREFYSSIDIAINPNISGTGLKIKSVEALSFGAPFISMADGMVGIASDHAHHQCRTMAELVDALAALRAPDALAAARRASREVFSRYARAQTRAFEQMLDAIRAHRASKRLAAS
jgi:hypothetical protein